MEWRGGAVLRLSRDVSHPHSASAVGGGGREELNAPAEAAQSRAEQVQPSGVRGVRLEAEGADARVVGEIPTEEVGEERVIRVRRVRAVSRARAHSVVRCIMPARASKVLRVREDLEPFHQEARVHAAIRADVEEDVTAAVAQPSCIQGRIDRLLRFGRSYVGRVG